MILKLQITRWIYILDSPNSADAHFAAYIKFGGRSSQILKSGRHVDFAECAVLQSALSLHLSGRLIDCYSSIRALGIFVFRLVMKRRYYGDLFKWGFIM